MAGGSEQGERRELLEKLSGAQSPLKAADARAEADRWMARHPDDEVVRQAMEHLWPAEGEEDMGASTRVMRISRRAAQRNSCRLSLE